MNANAIANLCCSVSAIVCVCVLVRHPKTDSVVGLFVCAIVSNARRIVRLRVSKRASDSEPKVSEAERDVVVKNG